MKTGECQFNSVKNFIPDLQKAINTRDKSAIDKIYNDACDWIERMLKDNPSMTDSRYIADVQTIISDTSNVVSEDYEYLRNSLIRCKSDPEFYNLFKTFLSLATSQERNTGDGRRFTQNLNKSFKDNYFDLYQSKQLPLFDLSFLATNPSQTLYGKARKPDKEYPKLASGSLAEMDVSEWQGDTKNGVRYLSTEEKKLLKVRKCEDGVLRRDIDNGEKLPEGSYLYALSPKGGLYIYRERGESPLLKTANFHHSSFRGGQPLISAGHLKVDNFGDITDIAPNSGHYLTSEKQLTNAAIWLFDNGMIDENCTLDRGSTIGEINMSSKPRTLVFPTLSAEQISKKAHKNLIKNDRTV